jgi:hypothetical protein
MHGAGCAPPQCLQFKTDQQADLRRIERLNMMFFALMAKGEFSPGVLRGCCSGGIAGWAAAASPGSLWLPAWMAVGTAAAALRPGSAAAALNPGSDTNHGLASHACPQKTTCNSRSKARRPQHRAAAARAGSSKEGGERDSAHLALRAWHAMSNAPARSCRMPV